MQAIIKKKGKVFNALDYHPSCECGEDVRMSNFLSPEGEKIIVGMCECGNTFWGIEPLTYKEKYFETIKEQYD